MPTRRRLRSVPQPSSLVTSYVSDPWDPFDDEPLDPHEFPTDLEFQASWPTGVFILAMLSTAERDPIPAGVLQGLRDLAARHLHGPLDALTQRVLAEDEPSIRALGRETAELRLAAARAVSDERARERRVANAQQSVDRDGEHRWTVYLDAVSAVRRFASHAGVRSGDLPDDPTARLRVSQDNSVARRVLSPEEMAAVWEAAATFADPELACLVLDLVRETAARRQSVIDLRLDDICWGSSCLWLHTKGDQVVRQVASQDLLERVAVRAISQGWAGVGGAYPSRAPRWAADGPRAALRRADGSPLTRRWFDQLHNHIDRRVRLEGGTRFTVHYLRHTSVAQVDRIAGRDAASQFAGHSIRGFGRTGPAATSIYIRFTLDESKRLFTAMFPKTPPGAVDPPLLAEKMAWLDERGLER